jgi:hypothetical protein
MPNACRNFDFSSGHGCCPPSMVKAELVKDVYINKRTVAVVTDCLVGHGVYESLHKGCIIGGAEGVFANGRMVARVGDPLDCHRYHIMLTGSENVIVGGNTKIEQDFINGEGRWA